MSMSAMSMSMASQFVIRFVPSGRGRAQNPPDPAYPDGMHVDVGRRPACKAALPYPAPECGLYTVRCKLCDASVICTTAGRPDDPRSMMVPCLPIPAGTKAC